MSTGVSRSIPSTRKATEDLEFQRPIKRAKFEPEVPALNEDVIKEIITRCDEVSLFMLSMVFWKNRPIKEHITLEYNSRLLYERFAPVDKTQPVFTYARWYNIEQVDQVINTYGGPRSTKFILYDAIQFCEGQGLYVYVKSLMLGYPAIVDYLFETETREYIKTDKMPSYKRWHDEWLSDPYYLCVAKPKVVTQ